MSVNEDKNIGDAGGNRETDQGFTPGPWTAFEGLLGDEGVWIMSTHVEDAVIASVGMDFPEAKANARLIAAAPSLATFLMKIYLDYEGDCGCECDGETCCAVVGEKCAKCHANVALLLLDQPAYGSATSKPESV